MADKEEDGASEGSAKTGAETPEAITVTNEETPQSLEPASIDANLTNNEAPPPPVKGKKSKYCNLFIFFIFYILISEQRGANDGLLFLRS